MMRMRVLGTVAVAVIGAGGFAVAAPQASVAAPQASAGRPDYGPGVPLLRLNVRPVRPELPHGAVRAGTLAPGRVIRLDVTLKVPDPRVLAAFVAGVSDRRSPLFHRFLRRGQFGRVFGPPLAEVSAVDRALRAVGLSPGAVSANRLAIPVVATAGTVEQAFSVRLIRYRLPGGRVAF